MSLRALVAIAALTGTARAEGWDAGIGFGGGGEAIGGSFYGGAIVQGQVARHIVPRLAVSLIGELAGADDSERRAGVYRGLVGVDIAVFRERENFSPNLIASMGTGAETIMWDRGTLTRATSYIALEYRLGFSLSDSDFFRGIERMSWRFGVRGQVSPGVAETTVAKLCTACMSTTPEDPAVDFGFAVYMGLVFGR